MNGALHDHARGIAIAVEKVTVGEFLDRWLSDCVRPHRKAKTFQSYEQQIRTHIKPAIGRVALGKLNGQHVQAMVNSIAAKGKKRTAQCNRAILRTALGQAVQWQLISHNPAADGIATPKVQRHKVVAVSIEHARAILNAVAGHRLGPLFVLRLYTGLRPGEALGLSWSEVDLDKRTLRVRQTLQRVFGKLELGEPKTAESARSITLAPAVVTAFKEFRSRQLEERLRLGKAWTDNGLVFTTTLGTPVDPRYVKEVFDGLLQSAELPHMRLHDLRHACATLLLSQGESLKTISTVLGHSNISTTADIYAHVSQELIGNALDKLDAAIG